MLFTWPNKCKLKYVGSTLTESKVRFRNHKSTMRTNKKTSEVAVHFNCSKHEISEINFIVIKKIYQPRGRSLFFIVFFLYISYVDRDMSLDPKIASATILN